MRYANAAAAAAFYFYAAAAAAAFAAFQKNGCIHAAHAAHCDRKHKYCAAAAVTAAAIRSESSIKIFSLAKCYIFLKNFKTHIHICHTSKN